MTTYVAAKRLSRVEVSAEASNQHEFHAGQLRKALGLPESRTSGTLDVSYALADDDDTEGESCAYTISNVRADNPLRDEYHMYYSSHRLQQFAREGDILVLTRSSATNNIRGLVVRPGTELGTEVEELLAADGVELTSKFRAISTKLGGSRAAAFFGMAADSTAIPSAEDFAAYADEQFVTSIVSSGVIPDGHTMASQAGLMVERMSRYALNADLFLQWRLDAETTLFQQLERAIGQREMDKLTKSGTVDFGDAVKLVMKHLQSRRSRRGNSLQNHLAALLDRERIPFSEQCRTEHGEKPDFIVPSCHAYSDLEFPSSHLRMVACKSLLRERWDQILNEAARVPEKYLLTLDLGVPDGTIKRIRRSNVRLFIPQALADAAYRHHESRLEIESVAALVTLLASHNR